MWKSSEPQNGLRKYSSNQISNRAIFVNLGENIQVRQTDIFLTIQCFVRNSVHALTMKYLGLATYI